MKPTTRKTKPTVLAGDWATLAEAVGGVGALAEALSVNRTTIRRWAIGEVPVSGMAATLIRTVCAVHNVKSPV